MTLPVRISEEAEAEMSEAARWYETHRAGLGTEFLDVIDTAVARIAEAPRLRGLLEAPAFQCRTLPQVDWNALWLVRCSALLGGVPA